MPAKMRPARNLNERKRYAVVCMENNRTHTEGFKDAMSDSRVVEYLEGIASDYKLMKARNKVKTLEAIRKGLGAWKLGF